MTLPNVDSSSSLRRVFLPEFLQSGVLSATHRRVEIQAHTRRPPPDLSTGCFAWESVKSRYALKEGGGLGDRRGSHIWGSGQQGNRLYGNRLTEFRL